MSESSQLPAASSNEPLEKLYAELNTCMACDRHRLRRRLRECRKRLQANKPCDRSLAKIAEDMAASQENRRTRLDHLPRPVFDDELPVCRKRDEIAAAIREHQVVIVAGETGSGKTTQLPKICLELQRGVDGRIACTQPRRIAAISVAERVAEELGSSIGEAVGYQIRFEQKVSERTAIAFMTDGLLLAELSRDRFLNAYDTIILDEAHERSLNIDFLLGCLKQLLPKRPELKLIISSATLDVEKFQAFFGEAPILSVQGRTYPVELRYRPMEKEDPDVPRAVVKAVQEIGAVDGSGDILIFFASEADIRECQELLQGRCLPRTLILPLFGRLTAGEQRRVFQKHRDRKIVLATNVAETSLTVPGIRYVIDTGLARIKRYNPHTQVERLQIEAISKASSDQRKGRCGRIAPGICIRLYEEKDYEERCEYTDPEILRTSLAEVILQMLNLRLGEISAFPFIDPPSPLMIRKGLTELTELGAIDDAKRLTGSGRSMARLPIEPRYARMLLAGHDHHALDELLTITAALSIQDPRERPQDKRDAADAVHKQFHDERSDFQALLNLWSFCEDARRNAPSNNQFRKWCKRHFLSFMRLREWRNVRRQLREEMERIGCKPNTSPAIFEDIHKSLLAGLLSRLGLLTEKKHYRGSYGTAFHTFPGSGLFGRKPQWVMAAELVETKRLYGRCVAEIDPRWVEPLAENLCKRSYRDPHWDGRTGHVRAYEQVTVFGLPIVEKRRVHYGPIDSETARRIFIEKGLIEGDMPKRFDFLKANQKLIDDVQDLEHKARRRDLLVDSESLFQFYADRLPESIYTAKALERWLNRDRANHSALLQMKRDDVQLMLPNGMSFDRFPPEWTLGEQTTLPLTYRFHPGEKDDGVTVTVPVGVLPRLRAEEFEWLVPGLLPEKIALLIRSLPKSERVKCVPVPQTVEKILPSLKPGRQALCDALAAVLLTTKGAQVDAGAFRVHQLPAFLQMNFRVIDGRGRTIAEGRDLESLRVQLRGQVQERFEAVGKEEWEQAGLTSWSFGELPEQVNVGSKSAPCYAFPCLRDEGESVGLRLAESPAEADAMTRNGLKRLFALALTDQLRGVTRTMKLTQEARLHYGTMAGKENDLPQEILDCAVEEVYLQDNPIIREAKNFRQHLQEHHPQLRRTIFEAATAAGQALNRSWEISRALNTAQGKIGQKAYEDLRGQLRGLIFPGFPARHNFRLLMNLPRYLEGMQLRMERLQHGPAKDAKKLQRLLPFLEKWQPLNDTKRQKPAARLVHRLLEEFRISLFAQELGTDGPISEKRLEEAGKSIE